MDIGNAVLELKNGGRVAREAWGPMLAEDVPQGAAVEVRPPEGYHWELDGNGGIVAVADATEEEIAVEVDVTVDTDIDVTVDTTIDLGGEGPEVSPPRLCARSA